MKKLFYENEVYEFMEEITEQDYMGYDGWWGYRIKNIKTGKIKDVPRGIKFVTLRALNIEKEYKEKELLKIQNDINYYKKILK